MLVLNLFSDSHRRTPIDVFVSEPFDFDAEFENSVSMAIDEENIVPIVSLQTLLSMKREAGRPKDLLDLDYLNRLEPYRDAT